MADRVVKGDMTYLDLEYLHTTAFTKKSDVYSFGVILVELPTEKDLTCLKNPIIQSFKKEKKLSNLIPTNLENVGGDEMKEIEAVVEIAKSCLNDISDNRPEMERVAVQLAGLVHGETSASSLPS